MDIIASPKEVLDFLVFRPGTAALVRPLKSTRKSAGVSSPPWETVARDELLSWADNPPGALAMVIVLDRFALNMFRSEAIRYATGQKALRIARKAIAAGWHRELPTEQLNFLYLPFMHSESLVDQTAPWRSTPAPGSLRGSSGRGTIAASSAASATFLTATPCLDTTPPGRAASPAIVRGLQRLDPWRS